MTDEKAFLDTNIVVYAYDRSALEKHEIAASLLLQLWNSGLGLISTQVLQELFVTLTRKIRKPIDANVARQIVADFLKWDLVIIDGNTLLDAIDIHTEHRFSFWDSMIISAAIRGGAKTLYSEDLQEGLTIHSMTIKNPFVGRG